MYKSLTLIEMQIVVFLEKCPAFTDATEHGSLAASCDRMPGSSCQFTCMSGYRYASSQTSVDCVSGSGWSTTTTSLCEGRKHVKLY